MGPNELRQRRAALGLTQPELARRLGVKTNTVARWETGQRAIAPIVERALRGIEEEEMKSPRQAMIRRVRECQAQGLTSGAVVFGTDGSGGEYYTVGSRLNLGADQIAVRLDFASRARPERLVDQALQSNP